MKFVEVETFFSFMGAFFLVQDISFLDVDGENKGTQMKLRLSEASCSFPEMFRNAFADTNIQNAL